MNVIKMVGHTNATEGDAQDALAAMSHLDGCVFAYIDPKEWRVVSFHEDAYPDHQVVKGQVRVQVADVKAGLTPRHQIASPGLIEYTTDRDPTEKGVYACRVPVDDTPLFEDKFLLWFEGRWGFLGSDQRYRGTVVGWIGPLQRRI